MDHFKIFNITTLRNIDVLVTVHLKEAFLSPANLFYSCLRYYIAFERCPETWSILFYASIWWHNFQYQQPNTFRTIFMEMKRFCSLITLSLSIFKDWKSCTCLWWSRFKHYIPQLYKIPFQNHNSLYSFYSSSSVESWTKSITAKYLPLSSHLWLNWLPRVPISRVASTDLKLSLLIYFNNYALCISKLFFGKE